MTHYVITKHLVYQSPRQAVVDRESYRIGPVLYGSGYLGKLWDGPLLPIDDLDIIEEWKDLQEYVSTTAGQS